MEKGAKAWLIIEQEYVGENEPDGKGNWVPKIISRVIAGTEDADCMNSILGHIQGYLFDLERQGKKELVAKTMIKTDYVCNIIPTEVSKILQDEEISVGANLLDEILNGK